MPAASTWPSSAPTAAANPRSSKPDLRVLPASSRPRACASRIFGRERWEVFELRKRLGVVEATCPASAPCTRRARRRALRLFLQLHASGRGCTSPTRCASAPMQSSHSWRPAPGGQAGRRNVRRRDAPHPDRPRPGARARKMLLIDEPSNALDLAAQQELRQTLRRLARQGTGIRAGHPSPRRHSAGNRARRDAAARAESSPMDPRAKLLTEGAASGTLRRAGDHGPARRLLPRLVALGRSELRRSQPRGYAVCGRVESCALTQGPHTQNRRMGHPNPNPNPTPTPNRASPFSLHLFIPLS